jgi:CPA2 family monovalent cation:H+ antiporter-2
MHGADLIATLAGGLTAALVFGYFTQRLGLSPIVGYLIGGVVVGPYTPGFVADTALAEQLAEIGVILLMFGVGLQFHVEELLAVRRVAVPGAVAQSLVATGLGALVGRGVGWEWPAAMVFGVSLAVASTVVLIRVLADAGDLHTRTGHISVGWLVVEDLFTVIVLVVLPALVGEPASGGALAWSLAVTLLKVVGLVAAATLVGNRAIPWLLDRVAATRSRELFTLTVLVIALGIAVGSTVVFGVSMALGAFLAGLVVGRSDYSLRAASDALPMRDAFAVLFFVSVGMLLDPQAVLAEPMLVVGTLAVVMIGKPIVAAMVVLAMRYPVKIALAVSVALAQIGEFSFILASLGRSLGVLPAAAMHSVVAVAILSIVVNPLAYRLVSPLDRYIAQMRGRAAAPSRDEDLDARAASEDPAGAAVIVGGGPTGRTLARLLRDNGVSVAAIDLNMDNVRALKGEGIRALYGDAGDRATLEQAGVRRAGLLILAADLAQGREVIRSARALNPKVQVLARTAHLRDVNPLRDAGAAEVFSGEGQVAEALTASVLRRLGSPATRMTEIT